LSKPLVTTLALVVVGVALATTLPQREEVIPERTAFITFPQELGDWKGRAQQMESIYVDELKFDDYLLNDYINPVGEQINLYAAYYGSQRKGASVHSPRTCLPGGGWRIADFAQHAVDGAFVNGQPLRVNRALIKMGDSAQLVYYWFQQRGRVMTNEYLVKWYLFQDSVLRSRTDGALVRLTTFVPPGSDVAAADARLTELTRLVSGDLEQYIPN
jgi:EpsI family protein